MKKYRLLPQSLSPIVCFVILFSFFSISVVQAQTYEEIAAEMKSAKLNIENAGKAINESAQKVRESIEAIRNADSFEGTHWTVLDQSVTDWVAVMDQSAIIIDMNARTILRLDPTANVRLAEYSYFGIDMRGLRDQLRNVQADLQASIVRAEQTRQRQTQIRQGALDDIKDGVVNLTVNTTADVLGIPTSAGDAAGSVILKGAEVAGHWFAKPIGLAHTGIKFVVGFYYLADEAKSGARILKSADDVDAFAQDFISRTQANIRSAQQGIEWVEKLWSVGTETRNKFSRTQSEWRSTAAEASKQQAQAAIQKIEQAFEEPTPKIKIHSSWCASPVPDLEASEYKPEAESVLRELRSAAMAAAFDGGSPLAYHGIKETHLKNLHRPSEEAAEQRKRAFEAQKQAISQYLATLRTIGEQWGSCRRACRSQGISCAESCDARSQSARNQACSALSPVSTAYAQTRREFTRRSKVLNYVLQESWQLDRLIKKESEAAQNRYNLLFSEHSQAFDLIISQLQSSLRLIPSVHQLESYRNRPDWADRAIDVWMRTGNIIETRSMVAGEADRIREAGKLTQQALSDFKRLLPELTQTGLQARSELDAMQDRLGPLLYYDYTSADLGETVFSSYGAPRSNYTDETIQQRVAGAKQRTDRRFTFIEPDNIAAATRFPFESTARAVEARLSELDDLIGRLDTFNFRLSNINVELDKASRALTNQSLYRAREHSPNMQILSEFTSGEWAGFAQSVSTMVEQHNELLTQVQQQYGIPVMSQPNPTPRQQLLAFQNALLNYASQTMANYIRVSQHGGFLPVNPDDYAQILTAWEALKPLYHQHESLAAPERANVSNAIQMFPDENNLNQAYSALPHIGKSSVGVRYNRYRMESQWLKQYASRLEAELRSVSDSQSNDGMARLQEIIEGYPAAKAAWELRQAEQIREAEERRRQEELRAQQALEAQAQRQQAEATARLERQERLTETLIQEVPKVYQEFVDAYGRGDLRGLMRLLAPDWQGGDGADLRDVEEYLTNSFRVFDRIQYRISGFSATAMGDGRVRVSYSVHIVGENRRQRLTHEERSDVVEDLGMVDGQVRILRTLSGTQWLR